MKVRLNLAALTRLEFSKEVEVPDNITSHELDDLVRKAWDESDYEDFSEDHEYFEKGHCWWDKLDEDGEVTCSSS